MTRSRAIFDLNQLLRELDDVWPLAQAAGREEEWSRLYTETFLTKLQAMACNP